MERYLQPTGEINLFESKAIKQQENGLRIEPCLIKNKVGTGTKEKDKELE